MTPDQRVTDIYRYADYGYRRSRDGKTIHRVGCRFITRNTVHWHYPENFDLRDPAALRLYCEARAPWLHFCKVCFP